MKLVRESAEHFFLTQMETLKGKPEDYFGLFFSLSKNLKHDDLVADLSTIQDNIQKAKARSDVFAEELHAALDGKFEGSVCVFKDMDIFVIVKLKSENERAELQALFKQLSAKLPKGMADMDTFANQSRAYQKFADQKLLSVKCMASYDAMADMHKIASIPSRRRRREDPLVMLVEDDRFTAHYASNILNTKFDLIVCKDGESAIQQYIETAPDIVFMDVHLPGMTGHQALQAIHAVDEGAFVVMLSVDTVRENIQLAASLGASNFIKKPFTKERLIDAVKNSPYVRAQLKSDRVGSEQMFH
ncbi:MAG: response regulator [Alphaproteobacteria bacterium]|nr:response regulator [Alphaproteobacteria bacterium]